MSDAQPARVLRRRRVVAKEVTDTSTSDMGVTSDVGVDAVETCSREEFLNRMNQVFKTQEKDPETMRYSTRGVVLPEGASIELYQAFGVAYDVLETSYRPLECNFSRR